MEYVLRIPSGWINELLILNWKKMEDQVSVDLLIAYRSSVVDRE